MHRFDWRHFAWLLSCAALHEQEDFWITLYAASRPLGLHTDLVLVAFATGLLDHVDQRQFM